jgi:hypothetical protein
VSYETLVVVFAVDIEYEGGEEEPERGGGARGCEDLFYVWFT